MAPAQVKIYFSDRSVPVGRAVKDRHVGCVPPTRSARAIEHVPSPSHDPPHYPLKRHGFDRPDKVQQPVIKRAPTIHLKIDPAIQPLNYFKNLGRSPFNNEVIGTQSSELRMRRLEPQPHLVRLVQIR